jgi:RimJ/RimL family protein N-acetyltransferase
VPAIDLPQRIEGERCVLRRLTDDDLAPYAHAFAADAGLGLALGSETDPTEESLQGRPELIAKGAEAGEWFELAIADLADDRLLGTITMHSFDWRHQHAEVGFWLMDSARGSGIATEATRLIVDWTFANLEIHRVELITLPSLSEVNRTIALAERLGFTYEGRMRERNFERGKRLDTLMYAVLREDWASPLI